MSIGILELLRRVGEDNVRVQNVLDGDVNVQATKHGTRVTFYTDPSFISPGTVATGNPPMVGLVVWMPRALVDQARSQREAPPVSGDLGSAAETAEGERA